MASISTPVEQQARYPLLELMTVDQTCKRIVTCLPSHLAADSLALGDVAQGTEHAVYRALLVDQERTVVLDEHPAAGLALHSVFSVVVPSMLSRLLQKADGLIAVVRVNHLLPTVDVGLLELRWIEAGDTANGAHPRNLPRQHIVVVDNLSGLLGNNPVALLAFLENLLSLDAVANVAIDAVHAHLIVIQLDRHAKDGDVHFAPILAPAHRLLVDGALVQYLLGQRRTFLVQIVWQDQIVQAPPAKLFHLVLEHHLEGLVRIQNAISVVQDNDTLWRTIEQLLEVTLLHQQLPVGALVSPYLAPQIANQSKDSK